jgi:hypothetical protein
MGAHRFERHAGRRTVGFAVIGLEEPRSGGEVVEIVCWIAVKLGACSTTP